MIFCDGGSSYSKIYDSNSGELSIIPTRLLVKDKARRYHYSTGHSSKAHSLNHINELIALGEGSLELISDKSFTVLDIGSRDMKFVSYQHREAANMDWNNSCGGNMGFTLEVLGKSYEVDYENILPARDSIPVTCGLLGVEKVFDQINQGDDPETAIARFVLGMAKVSHNFCGKPSQLYLSGGLSANPCFIKSLSTLCDVKVLGREVLLHGLMRKAREEGHLSHNPLKSISGITQKTLTFER
ncbi:MAG: ATPase [Spirochaetota bacterium]|nr:ATPase [Spirochaetota bacterium]